MVYLINSSAFRKDDKGKVEFFFLLKIGYTGDDDKTIKSRFGAYKLHNPTYEVLYTIPGLTVDEESKIQKKFKDYLFPDYGDEWFYYNDEIIKFFDKLSKMSKNEIEKFIKELVIESDKTIDSSLDLEERKFIYDNKPKIKLILSRVLSISECSRVSEINNILINSYENGYKDFPGLLEYVKKKYGESVIKEYKDRMKILDENLDKKKIVEEYHERTTIVDKLKLLCENNIDDIILANIPDSDELKSLYKVVGPDRIKATGYNITILRKEFSMKTFDDIEMYKNIFENSKFRIGTVIEGSEIKLEFKSIYFKNNYSKTPKAVDIFDYFQVEKIFISIPDPRKEGKEKRALAYKILDYKKDSKAYIAYQEYLKRDQSNDN